VICEGQVGVNGVWNVQREREDLLHYLQKGQFIPALAFREGRRKVFGV
jgi:hypothetical protein